MPCSAGSGAPEPGRASAPRLWSRGASSPNREPPPARLGPGAILFEAGDDVKIQQLHVVVVAVRPGVGRHAYAGDPIDAGRIGRRQRVEPGSLSRLEAHPVDVSRKLVAPVDVDPLAVGRPADQAIETLDAGKRARLAAVQRKELIPGLRDRGHHAVTARQEPDVSDLNPFGRERAPLARESVDLPQPRSAALP